MRPTTGGVAPSVGRTPPSSLHAPLCLPSVGAVRSLILGRERCLHFDDEVVEHERRGDVVSPWLVARRLACPKKKTGLRGCPCGCERLEDFEDFTLD